MEWNAFLEYHPRVNIDDAEGDFVAVFAERLAGSLTENEWLDTTGFRFTFSTPSVNEAALDVALDRLRDLLFDQGLAPTSLVHIELVPEEWVDRFESRALPLMGLTELAERAGVSRQRVAQLAAHPDFPAPAARLAAGPVWAAGPALEWLERPRQPGRPKQPNNVRIHGKRLAAAAKPVKRSTPKRVAKTAAKRASKTTAKRSGKH